MLISNSESLSFTGDNMNDQPEASQPSRSLRWWAIRTLLATLALLLALVAGTLLLRTEANPSLAKQDSPPDQSPGLVPPETPDNNVAQDSPTDVPTRVGSIFIERLPTLAPLALTIDPAADRFAYQQDKQLWIKEAGLNGEATKIADCADQDQVICELPRIHWSPDGSRFFYQASANDDYQLIISDLQGRQVGYRFSRPPSRDPLWSPDGSKIVAFIVDTDRPWGDHADPSLSPLDFGFINEVWQLQVDASGTWLEPQKMSDLEIPGIGCGGGGTSTSDTLYDMQGGFALGYQAARQMAWAVDDVILYPLTCDYWQGYGRLDAQTGQPLEPYPGQLRGLTLDSSAGRWYAITGYNRDDDPANNRLVTGTSGSPAYDVIETAVPVDMVFVGPQSGHLYYTARQRTDHKDLSAQVGWNGPVSPYFNFYHTQLWTIQPDGAGEMLLWESDHHSYSRVTETMDGAILFVLIENDVALYESMAGGAPEEEWLERLPATHIMRLSPGTPEPEIWLQDVHNLVAWQP